MDQEGAIIGGTVLFTMVIIVVSIAATVIPLVIMFRWLGKMRGDRQQILITGIPAQGRIMQMGPTGLSINGAPQMNLVVEIHPPQQPGYRGAAAPFIARIQDLVPIYAMASVQPGATVPVRFDPMNPQRAAIDFRSMGFL